MVDFVSLGGFGGIGGSLPLDVWKLSFRKRNMEYTAYQVKQTPQNPLNPRNSLLAPWAVTA